MWPTASAAVALSRPIVTPVLSHLTPTDIRRMDWFVYWFIKYDINGFRLGSGSTIDFGNRWFDGPFDHRGPSYTPFQPVVSGFDSGTKLHIGTYNASTNDFLVFGYNIGWKIGSCLIPWPRDWRWRHFDVKDWSQRRPIGEYKTRYLDHCLIKGFYSFLVDCFSTGFLTIAMTI